MSPDLSEETKTSDTETIKHSSSSIIGLRSATFDKSCKDSEVEEINGLKPRPPPKPRPWSIVGVDRKSGEFTQVDPSAQSPGDSEDSADRRLGSNLLSQSSARGSVRDMIASLNKPDSPGKVPVVVAASSVRDRIANMNKGPEVESSTKRKGNSLPREGLAVSPGTVRQKNSPVTRKKEETSDDPRILKLDDDFMFEDTVNV